MVLSPETIGSQAAKEVSVHLFDPSRRSTPEQMDEYLRRVRYPFVEDGEHPDQQLVDCILADGIDAGVMVRNYTGSKVTYDYFNGYELLEHNRLPQSTRRRLQVAEKRAIRMNGKIEQYVDPEAEWETRTLQAAWRICQLATVKDGQIELRKNDKRPFSVHPLESAAVLMYAIEHVIESGIKIPQKEIIALLATALMHDAPEDWAIENDHYNLSHYVDVISPLVIKRSMAANGMGAGLPTYISNACRLMVHEKGQPWMQSYEEYIARLSPSFLAAIVKPAGDNYNNYQIDRLPIPVQNKGENREEFMARLAKYKKKQAILAKNIFGNGVTDAANKRNAYNHDSRAVAYGRQILEVVRGLVYRPGDEKRYPHVDWSKSIPLDEFRDEALPEIVDNFRVKYSLTEPMTIAS